MSNPQGPPLADMFNRTPKRTNMEVIIDSANRDKSRFPESNNFEIGIPVCPVKNIRNTDILFMTIIKTEKTIHGDKLDENGNILPEYSPGNQILKFNEGIKIHEDNRLVRFRLDLMDVIFTLPKSIQEICTISLVSDRIVVTTPNPHSYHIGQSLRLSGYPWIPDCSEYAGCTDPNTLYEVVEITNNVTAHLLPLDRRFSLGTDCDGLTADPDAKLCPLKPCDSPRLLLDPPIDNQSDLAQLTESTYNYIHRNDDSRIQVTWGCVDRTHLKECNTNSFYYTITSLTSGNTFVTSSLLPQGTESYVATVAEGHYNSDELAQALQTALNQPTIVSDVNDRFEFREMDSDTIHTVILPAGTYTPETLAQEIAHQMNSAPDIVNSYVCLFYEEQHCFTIQTDSSAASISFELRFENYPNLASLLGFVPLNQSGATGYASQIRVYFPIAKPHYRSNNRYAVHYNDVNRKFTIVSDGSAENSLVSVTPLEDGAGNSQVLTLMPHGMDIDDVVIVMNPPTGGPFPIASGYYVVLSVCDAFNLILNMAVCEGEPCVEVPLAKGTVFTGVPKPFNIDFSQPHSGILDLLGLEPTSKVDQTVYQSTRHCINCQPLYLLVQIPEFVDSRLWAQYEFNGPAQKFFCRLDADFDDHTYKLTKVHPPIDEDLFFGNTLTLSKITVRIMKPDGHLYDTDRCDFSFWLRLIRET